MPSIQVKDVPPEVHATLTKKAAASGKSLQAYLLERLRLEADSLSLEEVLQRVERQTGGRAGLLDAAAAVRADRDSR